MFTVAPAFSQVDVLTHHNDKSRSGANLSELQLDTANVNSAHFGKLFEYSVDAPIFGQPLVLANLAIPGKGTRNVVFVATMNNSVYAYDADDPTVDGGQPIWRVNFNNAAAGITPVPSQDISNNKNYKGPYGIMGTPVIDRNSGVMYLVARTKETNNYFYRLHALDIATGGEKSGSPVVVDATVVNSAGTTLSLSPRRQSQRPALALANGLVYVGWASTEDLDPFQGWLVAYNATTLAREAIFNTVPTGTRAGIWMSGHAPAIDADGNVYITVGNGTWDGNTNFGQSVVKLSPMLSVLDWFTPDNWSTTSSADLDVGSTGVLLIPETQYIATGSKEGNLYILRSANLGHLAPGNTQIPQVLPVAQENIHGAPVFWNGPPGPLLYVWGEEDYLKAYRFTGQSLDPTPQSKSPFRASPGMPGGFLSLSANGAAAGTGVVWAALPLSQDAAPAIVPGVLRAFDAADVSKELWNSQTDCRNQVGSFAKYVPPTVANGRVYLSTYSNRLLVYGLLNEFPATNTKLSGTVACSSATVNISSVGDIDWATWPNYVQKSSGGAKISNYTALGSGVPGTSANVGRTITWTDAKHPASGSTSTGVSVQGNGNGFQITVPADTTTRTLYLYVSGNNSSGKLNAHLSDQSGPDYTSSLSGAGQY
jgi:hypothetical protein